MTPGCGLHTFLNTTLDSQFWPGAHGGPSAPPNGSGEGSSPAPELDPDPNPYAQTSSLTELPRSLPAASTLRGLMLDSHAAERVGWTVDKSAARPPRGIERPFERHDACPETLATILNVLDATAAETTV